mmetsp:Transcript_96654/g.207396  ORF Transcript_96654/g.207396 Transcript_96654/m.207396 type:complete len:202 (-) Transcript_96654:374-979(-)
MLLGHPATRDQQQETGEHWKEEERLPKKRQEGLHKQGGHVEDASTRLLHTLDRHVDLAGLAACDTEEDQREDRCSTTNVEVVLRISRARDTVDASLLRGVDQVSTYGPRHRDYDGEARPHEATCTVLEHEQVHEAKNESEPRRDQERKPGSLDFGSLYHLLHVRVGRQLLRDNLCEGRVGRHAEEPRKLEGGVIRHFLELP